MQGGGAAAPGGTFIGSAVLSNTSCSATGNELQQKSVHYVDEYSYLCLNYPGEWAVAEQRGARGGGGCCPRWHLYRVGSFEQYLLLCHWEWAATKVSSLHWWIFISLFKLPCIHYPAEWAATKVSSLRWWIFISLFKLPCTLYPGLEGNELQQNSVHYIDEYSCLCLNYLVFTTPQNEPQQKSVRYVDEYSYLCLNYLVLTTPQNEPQQKSVRYVDEYSYLYLNYLVLYPGLEGNELQQKSVRYVDEYSCLCLNCFHSIPIQLFSFQPLLHHWYSKSSLIVCLTSWIIVGLVIYFVTM